MKEAKKSISKTDKKAALKTAKLSNVNDSNISTATIPLHVSADTTQPTETSVDALKMRLQVNNDGVAVLCCSVIERLL